MLEFAALLGIVRSTNYGVVVDGNELDGLIFSVESLVLMMQNTSRYVHYCT